jgi:trimeric autotransporter adhesin
MTINRSTLLDLPLPVTGTEDGTWGDVTNNGLTQYLDIAIAGMVSLTSSDFTLGDLTIALTEGDSSATNIANASAQYSALKVSSLAQNSTITAPGSNRAYKVINSDSTYSLTIKASGQTGVTFAPGTTGIVAFNGTDYEILGVVGPASATDNAVPKFDGTTGQIIQGSGVTIDDSNNVSGVAQLNATTADLTNLEVTNIKAKDGTASATITDSTGAFTISTELSVDNININGNTIVSSDTDGDLNLTPNGTGDLVLDGLKWPQADGSEDYVLSTDGAGQLSWAAQTGGGGGGGTSVTVTQATATAAQTDFSVTYTVGQLSVYLNGALLASGDFTASNGTTVVLASGAALNDIFTAVAYSTVAGLEIESASPYMTAVGSGAGAVNTGANNTALGYLALTANTTGANNTAVGWASLDANTTGIYNTAVGSVSLTSNETGSYNTAVGVSALNSNTTGSNNGAFGSDTGGYSPLWSNTTGSNNNAFGNASLSRNTTGTKQHRSWVTQALLLNTTGTNNTAVGSGALDAATSSDNCGFGFTSLGANTTGRYNTAVGTGSAAGVTTSTDVVAIGFNSAASLTTGSYGVYIGSGATASAAGASGEIVICHYATTGKGNNTGFINPGSGPVYQGNNSSSWSTTSDQRLKKNIVDNIEGLEKINALRVRNFEYRLPEEVDPELNPSDAINREGVQLGVIAQELQQVCPDCVTEQSTGVLSVDTDEIFWHMVNAIKELSAKCDSLQAEINTLKGQ